MKHCDDYIDDEAAPAPLRAYLARARSSGHGLFPSPAGSDPAEPFPRLFADWRGERVRVVMASRFGDVGVTRDLRPDGGLAYQARVAVEDLTNFWDTP